MKKKIVIRSLAAVMTVSIIGVSSISLPFNTLNENVVEATENTGIIDPLGLKLNGDKYEISLDQFKSITGISGDIKDFKDLDIKKLELKKLEFHNTDGLVNQSLSNAVDSGHNFAIYIEYNNGTKYVYTILSNTKFEEKISRISSLINEDGKAEITPTANENVSVNEGEEKSYPKVVKIELKDTQLEDNKYILNIKAGLTIAGEQEESISENKMLISPTGKELSITGLSSNVNNEPTNTNNNTNNANNTSNNGDVKEDKEDKEVYEVPVKLYKADAEEFAKGSGAIVTKAKVDQRSGNAKIYIDVKGLEVKDSDDAYITKLYVYDSDLDSSKSEAKIYSTYNIKEKDTDTKGTKKPKTFLIERDKIGEEELFVEIESDTKDKFDSEARLIFDYSKKEKIEPNKIPSSESVSMTKKPITTTKKPTSTTSKKTLPKTGSLFNTTNVVLTGIVAVAVGLFIGKKK